MNGGPLRRLGSPVVLLGTFASFVVTAYAGWRLLGPRPLPVALWLLGAAVVHDTVVLPAYTLLDRALSRLVSGAGPVRNFVRVPAWLSVLLLAVYWPLILRTSDRFAPHTGLRIEPYLWNWLAVSGCLFAVSGVWYAVRRARRAGA